MFVLNHVDLQVPHVTLTAAFFVDHFGFEWVSTNRQSPAMAILRGPGPFTLVVQQRPPDERYPSGFHVGFLLPTPGDVVGKHTALTAAGVAVGPVSTNNRGTMFCLHAPGEVLIEVGSRPG